MSDDSMLATRGGKYSLRFPSLTPLGPPWLVPEHGAAQCSLLSAIRQLDPHNIPNVFISAMPDAYMRNVLHYVYLHTTLVQHNRDSLRLALVI